MQISAMSGIIHINLCIVLVLIYVLNCNINIDGKY